MKGTFSAGEWQASVADAAAKVRGILVAKGQFLENRRELVQDNDVQGSLGGSSKTASAAGSTRVASRRVIGLALCTLVTLTKAANAQELEARAETTDQEFVDPGRSQERGFAAITRPQGMVEFGVGWLTLPGAEVCGVDPAAGCRRGDTTPQIDAWQNFRLNVDFAVGAGITLGLLPTTDAPHSDPPGLNREHTRGYFMIESMARYYFYVGERFESYAGLAGGLVVVKDSYTPKNDAEYATVGTAGVIVRTEGYSVGLATGMAFALAPQWSAGAGIRFGSWFLPDQAERSPLGGSGASLTGRNTVASIGFNVAYRSTL